MTDLDPRHKQVANLRRALMDIYYQADPTVTDVLELQSMIRSFKRWAGNALQDSGDK